MTGPSNGNVTSLGEMAEHNARTRPDDIAFVHDGRTSTYAAHFERASRLCAAWRARGLRTQDRIAILAQNRTEFCEVCTASEIGGFITVTLNFRLSGPELIYILNDSEPAALVYDVAYRAIVQQIRQQLKSITHFVEIGGGEGGEDKAYETVLAGAEPEAGPMRSRPEHIAYLIYTSGTTGRPKGCILGQAETLRRIRMMAGMVGAKSSDRILLTMPLFHIGAKVFQLAQCSVGGTVHIHTRFVPLQAVKDIAASRITIAHLAPTMIQDILRTPLEEHDLASLRLIIYSAAPMPMPVLRDGIKRLGRIFLQGYGQTEGGGTCLRPEDHRPDGDEADLRRLASVGRPYPGTELRIADEAGNDVGVEAAGEILLRSQYNMRGYWNNSSASIAALRDGWLHTGDLGKLDADGFLYLLDRKKDMIVSGGENIYCLEVENALATMAAIREVAVFGMPDPKWGETVCAAVALKYGLSAAADDIIAYCRTQIASYKKPHRIYFVNELPRLNTGKVNKIALRERFLTETP